MTSTPLPAQPDPAAARPSVPVAVPVSAAAPAWGLEQFWPSRRGHAFDELCR